MSIRSGTRSRLRLNLLKKVNVKIASLSIPGLAFPTFIRQIVVVNAKFVYKVAVGIFELHLLHLFGMSPRVIL